MKVANKPDGAKEDRGGSLSVLSLNLRFGLADDGPNSWRYRKTAYPFLFEKHGADFFGFQEANDFQIEYLQEILTGYRYIGKRSPAPLFWQNNVIFYGKAWRCTYFEHFFLSPTPQVPSRSKASVWPRQCTIGMFEKDGRRLMCVNTHLDFDPSVQVESAKLIMKRLSGLSPDVPAILMGDFNATPEAPCYTVFTGQGRQAAEQGFYFKNAFTMPFPGTHHRFAGDSSGDHIDWILHRGGITLEECRVIQEQINGIYPSDHFPLYASFGWKN